MNRLPQELLVEILSRLPVQTLVQTKSVCRAWHILLQDQTLLNSHFNHMVDKDPCLILQITDYHIQNPLYFGDFSVDPDGATLMIKTKKLSRPPLLTFHLVSSCNGFLCLRATHPRNAHCIYIYNPFTRDGIELPKRRLHARVLGFGFEPTTNKYKVLDTTYRRKHYKAVPDHGVGSATHRVPQIAASSIESEVHVLTVGSQTWRNLGSFQFHFMSKKLQVLVHHKLHWICTPADKTKAINLIMSFDLANEQFKEVRRPDCFSSDKQFHELVVLRGCLSAVSFDGGNEDLEIWVMKEYDVKESWVKEFSIGGYVPKILQPSDECELMYNSRFYLPKQFVRVLCGLRSGGILLEYKNRELVVYDPDCSKFQDLQVTFGGIPRCFGVVVHIPSLNWIEHTFINT